MPRAKGQRSQEDMVYKVVMVGRTGGEMEPQGRAGARPKWLCSNEFGWTLVSDGFSGGMQCDQR